MARKGDTIMPNNTNSTILVSTLVGAAVGAGVALLVAPSSGEETRQKIKSSVGNLKQEAHDRGEVVKEAVSDVTDDIKDASRDVTKSVKKAGRNVKRQAV